MLFIGLAFGALGCPKDEKDFTNADKNMFPLGSSTSSASATPSARASASAAPLLDLCSLIPVAQVASATSLTLTATETPSGAATPECFYKGSARLPRVVIEKSLSTLAGAKQLWPGGKDLPGVGDAAYLAPKATELDVQKGSTVIRVGYEPANANASEAERTAILRKVVDLAIPALAK
ncbi:MAG: hypothetical protein ACRELY_17690 [Polyangiaceae bacterium]